MEPIRVEHWYEYIEEHPTFTGCLIDINDDVAWYKNGLCHRVDGLPALEYARGSKAWYKNGERHREDGPAVECANGDKAWYQNGLLHREDGPALELYSGEKTWWLNDVRYYNEEAYRIAMRKIKIEKVLKQIEEQNEKSM